MKEVDMLSNREIALELVNESERSPAAKAVFLVMGTRERDRTTLTLSSLYRVMLGKGFNYPRDEYVGVLKLLNRLGLAELQHNKRHRITGLKNIRVRMTSIGKVVFNKTGEGLAIKPPARKGWRPRPKVIKSGLLELGNSASSVSPLDIPKPEVPTISIESPHLDTKVTLYIRDKPITVIIPPEFTPEDIAHLITKIYR